jgi:predicted O-methyltransferase YrrM
MQTRWKKRLWIYSACLALLLLLYVTVGAVSKNRSATAAVEAMLKFDPSARQPPKEVLAGLPQPFLGVLSSMYAKEPQMGTDGAKHDLTADTGVWASDGMFLYNLCKRIRPERTLEVGFAEGFSTVFFLAALSENGRGSHFAIDPFEKSDWHGLGLHKVEELGQQQRFRFMEAKSMSAIPQLAAEGASFQVIFIDGDHRFDPQMLDFALADTICEKGGYLLFHDVWMASTQKLASFLLKNRPDYRPVRTGTDIAAFQKIGEDKREWRHFIDF